MIRFLGLWGFVPPVLFCWGLCLWELLVGLVGACGLCLWGLVIGGFACGRGLCGLWGLCGFACGGFAIVGSSLRCFTWLCGGLWYYYEGFACGACGGLWACDSQKTKPPKIRGLVGLVGLCLFLSFWEFVPVCVNAKLCQFGNQCRMQQIPEYCV